MDKLKAARETRKGVITKEQYEEIIGEAYA